MGVTDTGKLLRECDSGAKMAISSIDEVLQKVQDENLRNILSSSKTEHTDLENQIHTLLSQQGTQDKQPNPVAKSMSWMKTNVKLGMDASDETVAELITDGCNMGVKSLHRYLNEFSGANGEAKGICSRLITAEQQLANDMSAYL